MKKNPIILIMLATLLGLVTSCTTDELVNPNPEASTPGGSGQQITITATLGDANSAAPGTRMGYAPDDAGTGLKTTWAAGDAFNIVPFSNNTYGTAQLFTLDKASHDASADKSTGTFTGTEPATSSLYYIFHPANKIKTEQEFYSFSYVGQVQTENGNSSHLTAYHSIEFLTDNYQTINFNNTPPNNNVYQSSCMKFVLTLPVGITPTKITLATADGSTCFYSNNDGSATAKLELGLSGFDATTSDASTITAYMMMSFLAVKLPEAGITVIVSAADGSSYARTITLDKETTLGSGKTHTITVSDATTWGKLKNTTYTATTVASTSLETTPEATGEAGTPTNPYLIQSAEDLKMVQDITNDAIAAATYKNKCYKLTTDITIAFPTGTNWTPIGKDYDYDNSIDNRFKGTFDGDGHSVTGVYINTNQQYAGFFGYIKDGTVKDLNVTGSIKSSFQKSFKQAEIGGIAGSISNSSIIGCNFSGSVTGTGSQARIGGIAGYIGSTSYITGCNNSGSVTSIKDQAEIGGICGSPYSGYIIGCYNTGTVTTNVGESFYSSYRGGIAGNVQTIVSIIGCYNTGAVTGDNKASSGGIAGTSSGKVAGCYNTGVVTGIDDMMGGSTCGGIIASSGTNGTPSDCLWVKVNGSTATEGIGSRGIEDAGAAGTNIKKITDIATLNSTDNIGILNTAIDTWNSDADGGNGNTTSPKYCHFKFKAGTDGATPPTLVTEIP